MTVPMMPHRFTTGQQLDVEAINDNLEAAARDLGENFAQRYTYCHYRFPLTGLTDASAAGALEHVVRRFASGRAWEIDGVELVIYTATAVTWTLACSDTSWPSLALTTEADATVEGRAVSGAVVTIPSHLTSVTFTLSASGASTITEGYLLVRVRADRGSQGDSFTGYTPTLLNAASSTAGSVLDTQLTALETAVGLDLAADSDQRIECFVIRGVTAGNSVTYRVPSGQRRKAGFVLCAVAAIGTNVTLTVDGSLVGNLGAGGTGVTTVTIGTLAGSTNDDPMDPTDDTTIALGAVTGTVTLGYAFIFWD